MEIKKLLRETALILRGYIDLIIEDPKRKSDKEGKRRILAIWKSVFSNSYSKAETSFDKMILKAYSNTITDATSKELTLNEMLTFIDMVFDYMTNFKED